MVLRSVSISQPKRDVIHRIRTHAGSMPWRVAVEHGPRSVTHRELAGLVERRMLALAGSLRPGRYVAIEEARSIEFVVEFLAVLALDGIPVPIDPGLPDRHRMLLRDLVRPDVLLAASTTDGAHVLFTSGMREPPRPVLGSASALRAFLEWQCAEFGIESADRVAFLSALGAEAAVRELFLPLWAGATLVIPAEGDDATPESAVEWLRHREISVVNVRPSVALSWLRTGAGPCESVRAVFFAGEPVTADLLREWHARFPGTRIAVNFYGTTDTTLPKVYKRLDGVAAPDGVLPVGRPVPNARVVLIDPAHPLSAELVWAAWENPSSEGEVVLVSRNSGHGYVGMPEETRARFVDLGNGVTAFRTGDLGLLDESGELTIK